MSNEKIEYDRPDAGELLESAVTVLTISTAIDIASPAMYDLAAEQLRDVKDAIKTHTERRLGITRKMDDLKKDVMSLFTPALTKLEEAKTYLEGAMLSYNRRIEEERRIEQKKLDDAANAAKKRLEEEARRVQQEAENLAKQARGAKAKEEAAAAVARAAEEAEAIRLTASVVVAPQAAVQAPIAAGTSTRKTWKGRCDDKLALVKFVAEHPEYISLLEVDTTALNSLAKSQKENMKVAGCVAFEDIGITSRRA